MRWVKRYTRVVKRFALFPIKIGNEYRWLEIVYLKQGYSEWPLIFKWQNIRFIDEAEYSAYKKEDS